MDGDSKNNIRKEKKRKILSQEHPVKVKEKLKVIISSVELKQTSAYESVSIA